MLDSPQGRGLIDTAKSDIIGNKKSDMMARSALAPSISEKITDPKAVRVKVMMLWHSRHISVKSQFAHRNWQKNGGIKIVRIGMKVWINWCDGKGPRSWLYLVRYTTAWLHQRMSVVTLLVITDDLNTKLKKFHANADERNGQGIPQSIAHLFRNGRGK